MSYFTYVVAGWLTFITLIYLYLWYDRKEHHYNIVQKLTEIKETFTQDE